MRFGGLLHRQINRFMNIDKQLLDDLTASVEMHIVARNMTLATFSLKRNAYDDFRSKHPTKYILTN